MEHPFVLPRAFYGQNVGTEEQIKDAEWVGRTDGCRIFVICFRCLSYTKCLKEHKDVSLLHILTIRTRELTHDQVHYQNEKYNHVRQYKAVRNTLTFSCVSHFLVVEYSS